MFRSCCLLICVTVVIVVVWSLVIVDCYVFFRVTILLSGGMLANDFLTNNENNVSHCLCCRWLVGW